MLFVQTTAANEMKAEPEETAVTNGNADDNIDNVKDEDTAGDEDEDNVNGNEEDETDEPSVSETVTSRRLSATVTDDLLRDVASRLAGTEWKTLAQQLKFQEDDIAYFESEHGTASERAAKMLTVWKAS